MEAYLDLSDRLAGPGILPPFQDVYFHMPWSVKSVSYIDEFLQLATTFPGRNVYSQGRVCQLALRF